MEKRVNFVHVSVPMPVADTFLQNPNDRENYRFFRFTDDADMAALMVTAGLYDRRESAAEEIRGIFGEDGLSVSEGFSLFGINQETVLRIVNKA